MPDWCWTSSLLVPSTRRPASCEAPKSAAATLPLYTPEELVRSLASDAGVSEPRVERLIHALMVDLERCPDTCLTPIVPVGHALVPMSSLIAPGSPHRNLTAPLAARP